MADYLLHLVEVKLTSGFRADDSAGSAPIMYKIVPERHWSSTLTRPIKEPIALLDTGDRSNHFSLLTGNKFWGKKEKKMSFLSMHDKKNALFKVIFKKHNSMIKFMGSRSVY